MTRKPRGRTIAAAARRRLSVVFMSAVAAAAATAQARPAGAYPMPREFYELSEELIWPHVAWAKPLDSGPIKALVIAPRGAQRETIELAQRLDMRYTYVLALTPTELGWGPGSISYAPADGCSNDEMLDSLRAKLAADYDVIIIGHLDWKVFPPDVLYSLLKKVHDGTGLVYTHSAFGRTQRLDQALQAAQPRPEGQAAIARLVPFGVLPVLGQMGPAKVVTARQFKHGRLVALDYGPSRPRFQFLTPYVPDDAEGYAPGLYEYYMSLVIRSILWAARREPPVHLQRWGQEGMKVDRPKLAQTALEATLSEGPTGPDLEAELTVRRPDGTAVLTRRQRVAGRTVSLALAPLPRGRYFADLVLRRAGRSVDWATTYFDVETDVHVAGIQTDRKWYEPGQPIQVSVALSGALAAGRKLQVDLVDSLGRRIGSATPAPGADGRSAACTLAVACPLTITADLRASIREADQVLAEEVALVRFVRRPWDDFLFCCWSAGANFTERVRQIMFQQLRLAGIDTFTNSGRRELDARLSAREGFSSIPYMTRYHYDGKDLVRQPCLTDPKFLQSHLEELEKIARDQQPYDPPGYTLGDECYLARPDVDVCFSATCTADLRQWLRTEYGSVEELNRSWGTRYTSFDQAEPITLAEAKKTGQIPRWVDHRRHMEVVYARMMDRARAAIRRADPTARVGFDGPFGTDSCSGNDWWRLMEVFDLCNVYFHEPDEWEAVRSFARPGTLRGLWYGPYSTDMRREDYNRFFPWRALFNGFNSVWWYAVYHGLVACPMDALTPSLTWYGCFRATVEELREIKAGVGKALLHAQRRHDGIAVHYSQSSVHAATAYAGLGPLNETWRHWYLMLEDAGFQYHCLAYAQIEKQGIDASQYRVLVLPYSQAVSPREAEAMRAFVRSGGTLLADVRPAVADHHGRLHSPGLLDEVFGVRRPEAKLDLAVRVDGRLTQAVGPLPAGTPLAGLTVDPHIASAGAAALGQAGPTPILLHHRFGQGHAILLNFSLAAYASRRAQPEAATYWELLKALLASSAGLKPRAPLTAADGPLPGVETVGWQDGPVEYLGLLKYRLDPREPARTATVLLERAAQTYDVRRAQDLGRVDRFQVVLEPERAYLYARLPYAVRAVAVHADPETPHPGQAVTLALTLEADTDRPGRHWFRVEVFGPDDQPLAHYSQNMAVTGGRGKAVVPLALDDRPGTYRVTVRDVATGRRAQTAFQVR